jgi:hypothetical protein
MTLTMNDDQHVDELIELERAGWQALATPGRAAGDFYAGVLDHDVQMLFPGGMTIDDRDDVLDSMDEPSWDDFALDDLRVRHLTADTGVVSYRARASRGDQQYHALVASTYIRRADGWKLALHQHTAM